MIRIALISVVTLLLALPHGICFCEYVHTSQHLTEPEDTPDEDDQDCCCKLQFDMAQAQPDEAGFAVFLAIPVVHEAWVALAQSVSLTQLFDADRIDLPLAQIPCALRI